MLNIQDKDTDNGNRQKGISLECRELCRSNPEENWTTGDHCVENVKKYLKAKLNFILWFQTITKKILSYSDAKSQTLKSVSKAVLKATEYQRRKLRHMWPLGGRMLSYVVQAASDMWQKYYKGKHPAVKQEKNKCYCVGITVSQLRL